SYMRELYNNYSHLLKSKKVHVNFISYFERAQKIFDEDSKTINLMETQVKKQWKNIQSRLEQPE
ncbi:reverse transcriptase, partial [Bacillus subtilis]|nr:reverse transcriptase [Bacillus subtilis]